MDTSPLSPHASSPTDLQSRLEAERRSPFLIYRDENEEQHIVVLEAAGDRLTVGRGIGNDVCLRWDDETSHTHAELYQVGDDWLLVDDGLSRYGTFVNGARLAGRRRLRDGDVLRCGRTLLAFRDSTGQDSERTRTRPPDSATPEVQLSDAQRRVLVALCRPLKDDDRFARPATNRTIAAELFLSLDAVKTHMRKLFDKLGVDDLPQNAKRARLAEVALESGVVSRRELGSSSEA